MLAKSITDINLQINSRSIQPLCTFLFSFVGVIYGCANAKSVAFLIVIFINLRLPVQAVK